MQLEIYFRIVRSGGGRKKLAVRRRNGSKAENRAHSLLKGATPHVFVAAVKARGFFNKRDT